MIMTNAIGGYEPNASIGKITRDSKTYHVYSVAQQLGSDTFESLDDAIAYCESTGFEIIERKQDGYGCPLIKLVHTETAAAKAAFEEQENAKWASAEHGYIRFGAIPKSGKSINYATGNTESGVSVFSADFLPNGEYRLTGLNANQLWSASSIRNRKVYRVWGDVVGSGSDGEPVVTVKKHKAI